MALASPFRSGATLSTKWSMIHLAFSMTFVGWSERHLAIFLLARRSSTSLPSASSDSSSILVRVFKGTYPESGSMM